MEVQYYRAETIFWDSTAKASSHLWTERSHNPQTRPKSHNFHLIRFVGIEALQAHSEDLQCIKHMAVTDWRHKMGLTMLGKQKQHKFVIRQSSFQNNSRHFSWTVRVQTWSSTWMIFTGEEHLALSDWLKIRIPLLRGFAESRMTIPKPREFGQTYKIYGRLGRVSRNQASPKVAFGRRNSLNDT